MNPRRAITIVVGSILVCAAIAWAASAPGDERFRARALLTEVPDRLGSGSPLAATTTARSIEIDAIVERAMNRLPADMRADAAAGIRARAIPGTYLIELTARSSDARTAAAAANAFAEALVEHRAASELGRRKRTAAIAQAYLSTLTRGASTSSERDLLGRAPELQAETALPRTNLEVVEGATQPPAPEAHSRPLPVLLGAGTGGMLALLVLGAFALRTRRWNAMSEEGDGEMLATLPRHRSLGAPLEGREEPLDVTMAVQRFVDCFEREFLSVQAKVTLIASPRRFDGRTTVSLILARELARRGRKVLLVEGDLSNPKLSEHTARPATPGLVQVASGHATVQEAVQHVNGSSAEWDLLAAGARVERPGYVLNSASIVAFLRDARNTYDAVLIDAPPGAEAGALLPVADAVLVVRRPRMKARRDLPRWLQEGADENRLQVVTNATSPGSPY